MRLDTATAKARIVEFMLKLFDEEFAPYAIKNNLWFFNSAEKIWLSPRQMREQIAQGRCNISKLHQWEYVGPNNLSKYARERVIYWYKVELEAKEEEKSTEVI